MEFSLLVRVFARNWLAGVGLHCRAGRRVGRMGQSERGCGQCLGGMELRQQESVIKSARSRGALPLWRVPRPSAAGRGESGAESDSGMWTRTGFLFLGDVGFTCTILYAPPLSSYSDFGLKFSQDLWPDTIADRDFAIGVLSMGTYAELTYAERVERYGILEEVSDP